MVLIIKKRIFGTLSEYFVCGTYLGNLPYQRKARQIVLSQKFRPELLSGQMGRFAIQLGGGRIFQTTH